MKKVVNLVTNYMSALCETGRVPGRVDCNIKAGTAVYFPGGGGYYTARTPDGRDIIGKGENGVFVGGGGYRRVVVRVHKGTESIEVYFGMERNGLISALEVGGDHFEAGLEYYRRETRPATEAEEKEAVKYLRARNYTHFKLSKRCALKR